MVLTVQECEQLRCAFVISRFAIEVKESGVTHKEVAYPPFRLPKSPDLEPLVHMLPEEWKSSLIVLSSCKKAPTDIFSPFCFLGAAQRCQSSFL